MPKDLVIPYNSVPDYDDYGVDSYWDLATWVAWHRGLIEKFGRLNDKDGYPLADKIWLTAWVKQTAYSSPLLAILQPSRFKVESDYIKKYPLLYQYSGLKTASEMINPLETSYKFTKLPFDVVDKGVVAVSDAASAVSTTAKILKFAVPAIAITGIGLLIWFGVRKVKSAS